MNDTKAAIQTNGVNDENMSLTITFLGCGNLNTAILVGILDSLSTATDASSLPSYSSGGISGSFRIPSRFIACVRSETAARRIKLATSKYDAPVEIVRGENARAVDEADVILLGCKPYMVRDILSAKHMEDMLGGKLLISICAGMTVEQIRDCIASNDLSNSANTARYASSPLTIVRVMPNTAALVRQSMSVIAASDPPLSPQHHGIVEWIFSQVGQVVTLPPNLMDVSTALCGSGPAFFSVLLEAAVDGAVAMGLPRAEALKMATQTMRGTTGLVQGGEHPAVLREKVTTPGGCTAGGLIMLEEGAVRAHVSKAIREATGVAGQLGGGGSKAHVNGTRGR